jgi:hypothetical protein
MFSSNRYATARVSEEVPFELQLFMWMCIDGLGGEADYLQVFELTATPEVQRIVHTQEQPEYRQEYLIKCDKPLSAKIFVIDDVEYATMLFAEEY